MKRQREQTFYPKPNVTQIQNSIHFGKEINKKKIFGSKKFRNILKNFFFLNFLDPKIFWVSNIFFLLISIPKCIELNSGLGFQFFEHLSFEFEYFVG